MTTETIIEAICHIYRITPEELFAKRRFGSKLNPRHMFFYLAKKMVVPKLTFWQIGEVAMQYGREKPFDHSTVFNGAITFEGQVKFKAKDDDYLAVEEILNDPLPTKLVIKYVDLLRMCG